MIQNCPNCKKETWFRKKEYSRIHLVMICEECGVYIRTLLEWEHER